MPTVSAERLMGMAGWSDSSRTAQLRERERGVSLGWKSLYHKKVEYSLSDYIINHDQVYY